MEQFPVLVEHGPLIWRTIQILFVVVVVVAVWLIRRQIARGELRASQRRIRANHGAIRGVLRGGGVTTVTTEATGPAPAKRGITTWRAESLVLETADRTIELAGDVRVVGGSRFDARRGRLPVLAAPIRDAIAEAAPWATKQIHGAVAVHLVEGDEIEVRGTPEPSAGQREVTARDADVAWSLRGGDSPLELAAIRPVIPRLPLGLIRGAIVIALAGGTGVLALRSCGDGWSRQCGDLAKNDGETPVELDNGHACVLAASTPRTRDEGLGKLYRYLDEQPYRDAAAIARLDELAPLAVSCKDRTEKLYRDHRFETALSEARRCGDQRIEHKSLVSLGYFEQAAALHIPATSAYEPALPERDTLIAAGRWSEAAAMVRNDVAPMVAHREYRACLADWLAQQAGDTAAQRRVETSEQCASLREDLAPHTDNLWLQQPEAMLVRTNFSYEALDLWGPFPEDTGLMSRAIRLRHRAVKQVLDNDTDGAIASAREVEVLARQILERADHADYAFALRTPAALLPAIQLYTPTIFDGIAERFRDVEQRQASALARMTREPDPRTIQSIHDNNGTRFYRLYARSAEPLTPQGTEWLSKISIAARAGELEQVMAIVQARDYRTWDLSELIAVIPHVPALRTRLARELPYLAGGSSWTTGFAAAALEAAVNREMLEAVGATEAAAAWDVIYRRYDAVLRDPARVRAFQLIRF